MAVDQDPGTLRAPFERLSKQEIDRRIGRLLAEMASPEGASSDASAHGERLAPRWITPAELVRRVRPFLSQN